MVLPKVAVVGSCTSRDAFSRRFAPQYKEKVETMILKTIAISPRYNGKGMGYILIDELVKEAERSGYKNVIYALMHEKNISKNIGSLLGDELRRYALFIKEL